MAVFQTKNFLSIVASMINAMRLRTSKINDYSVGSVARTMVEAPAQEIDELYQQMVAGLVAAIPVATYLSFGFLKLTAQAAGGLVRVQFVPQAAVVVIPSGAVLSIPNSSVTYASTQDAVLAIGASFVDVPVVATVAGTTTNVAVNTTFTLAQPPSGVVTASNLVAFIAGSNDETDAEQKTRFQDFIVTLSRGTVEALRYGAIYKSFLLDPNGNVIERVAFAYVDEPYERDAGQPPGLVNLYIHNGTGATSANLVSVCRQVEAGYYLADGTRVPGYKAAGAHLVVAAATELQIALTAVLTGNAQSVHAELVQQAKNTAAAYLLGLDIGETCIMARISELIMEIAGVTNFVYAAGTVDQPAALGVKLMPGLLAIT